MGIERFQKCITSIDQLTSVIGTSGELVIRKQLPELDEVPHDFAMEILKSK